MVAGGFAVSAGSRFAVGGAQRQHSVRRARGSRTMALFTPQATTLSSDPQTQSAGQDSLMSVNICDTLSPVLALVSTWMASISLAYLQQQGLASLRP